MLLLGRGGVNPLKQRWRVATRCEKLAAIRL
jgi:hypothetical protein